MLFTVMVEIAGHAMLSMNVPNHWLYNLYLPVEMLFKYYLLYKICNGYFPVKYLAVSFLALFGLLYAYEGIASGFNEYSVWSNSAASVGILTICCFYFYYFLKKEEYVDIYQHAPFWIVTALFFFYLGGTACNVFFKYLANIYEKQHIPVRYIIYTLLNFIFYGCWSYSFVCRYRQTTSSLS
ncbi:hypothetical protein GWC94_14280 [Sediminibacterium sp. WSJ-3]|nr:hypothetical protein [Sediminibacterium soli]